MTLPRPVRLTLLLLSALSAQEAEPGSPAPQRVLVVGDSMMRVPAHAIELQLARLGDDAVESRAFTRLGSGLARLDAFDWMEKLDELVEDFRPTLTIAWFGANDRQPMRTDNGIIRPGSDEWSDEYARRVGLAMDTLTAPGDARVLWLELPDMREASMQEDARAINELVRTEADQRDRVSVYSTRTILSRQPGTFTMHIAGPTGMPIQIRDRDGVHLNRAGADWLAEALVEMIAESGSGRR